MAVLVWGQRNCWLQPMRGSLGILSRGIPCVLGHHSTASPCRGGSCRGKCVCRAAEGCRARPKALRGLRGQTGAHWAPLVCPLTQDHWSAQCQGRVSPYRVCSSFGVLSPGLWGPQHCRMGVLSSPPSPAPTPGDIAWAGLSPTGLQSELTIKNPNQTHNHPKPGSGWQCWVPLHKG